MLSSIVISSRIRLARNLYDLPFPNKLCDFESASNVSKAIFEILGEDYEYRRLKNLSNNQCLLLLESHEISKELIGNKDIAGYAKSPDGQITIMINEEDHLREQCIIKGFDLKRCYEKISKIDDMILDRIDIAFSKELGFLTSCPTNVGTGMRASVMLFLPALTLNGAMKQLIESLNQNGITVRGLYGENSSCSGYFYQISNKYTLGLSEEDIIEMVEKNVKKIIEMEETARKTLQSVNESVIIDMSYRAYGILTNSYTISTEECLQLLSKLRFGIVLGLVKFKNPSIIDELYTNIEPAHLMDYYSLELSPKEQGIFRAKYIYENLENKLIKGV